MIDDEDDTSESESEDDESDSEIQEITALEHFEILFSYNARFLCVVRGRSPPSKFFYKNSRLDLAANPNPNLLT
jgi:hypothetical protein